jgi:hypothetical protein
MKRGIVVVGGGVVLVVVVVIAVQSTRDHGSDRTTMTLTESGGVCLPSDPAKLGGKKETQLRWDITNNCSTPQVVRFQDFSGIFGQADILDPSAPTSRSINANGGTDQVQARIKKGTVIFYLNYKYAIYVGPNEAGLTKRLDPDVEIWP